MIYLLVAMLCLVLIVRFLYDDYRIRELREEVEYLYKIHRESK